MDISKKGLIISFIINIVLVLIAIACVIITKFDTVVLVLGAVATLLILWSSIILWRYAKEMKK